MRGLVWLTLAATMLLSLVVVSVPAFVAMEHAESVVAAFVICIGAGWVAMMPPVLAMSWYPEWVIQAGASSIALRLLVTLSAGMAYFHWARPPLSPFTTAMVGCYLVLLVVETGVTVYWSRGCWKPRYGNDQRTA